MAKIFHLLPHAKHSVMALNDIVVPSQQKKLLVKQGVIVLRASMFSGLSRAYYTTDGFKVSIIQIGLLPLLLMLITTRKRRHFHIHIPRHLFLAFVSYINKNAVFICTIHNDYKNFKKIYLLLFFLTKHFFAMTVCVSKSVQSSMRSFHTRSVIIDNSVPTAKVSQYSKQNREIDLVVIGRFVRQKNVEKILKIINCLPKKYHIVWVGDGVLHDNMIARCEHTNIEFIKEARREEVYKILGNSKCYLSLSLWEGTGVATLEAIAAGCKVIISDIPVHREIANFSGAFVCSDTQTIYEISKQICSFIEYFAYKEVTRDFVMNYENSRMLQKYQDLYTHLIGGEK